MIEIIQEYWRNYLFTDGYRFSGLAITLWLLVVSIGLGFCLPIPLAVARVSKKKWLAGLGLALYVCLPRHAALRATAALLHRPLQPQIIRNQRADQRVLPRRHALHAARVHAEHLRVHHRDFRWRDQGDAYGEIEAARAYGMSKFTLYRRVILPSALRRALPYYSNEVILMLHATTVAFTATVPDILKIARDVNSATYASFKAFGIAALLYLCISFALVWLFRRAERRWLAYLRPQGN